MTDWKPGDVAMVTDGNVEWVGMIRRRREANSTLLEIAYAKGGFDIVDDFAEGYTIRPLVVIDPDDTEQVERLREAWDNVGICELDNEKPLTLRGIRMRAALREFAQPTLPRPNEPTGLGAVVEDTEGGMWVRGVDGWWRGETPGHSCNWNAIALGRVLSEGLPA